MVIRVLCNQKCAFKHSDALTNVIISKICDSTSWDYKMSFLKGLCSNPDKRGNRDNLGIISIFLHKNIFSDPSLEPSHSDSSNKGSQHMFSLKNKKNYI